MAFDKVIDSTKLNACLTAEADAIRAKTGGLLPLTFDYANSKGLADEIAAIQTGGGGGLPSGIQSLASGTYTSATDKTSGYVEITHDLGVVPDLIVMYANNDWTEAKPALLASTRFIVSGKAMSFREIAAGSVYVADTSNAGWGILAAPSTTQFRIAAYSGSAAIVGGWEYTWIAVKFKEASA